MKNEAISKIVAPTIGAGLGAVAGLVLFALSAVGGAAPSTPPAPVPATPARPGHAAMVPEREGRGDQEPAVPAPAPAPAERAAPAALAERGFERRTIGASDPLPRDEGEWQGMLVDQSIRAACDTTARCGLAMACVEGACGACVTDDECGAGEACVLDHCVPERNVECRTRHDCRGEELCVLSGYSDDLRGNGSMSAFCRPMDGGDDAEAETPYVAPPEDAEFDPRPVRVEDLLERLDGAP